MFLRSRQFGLNKWLDIIATEKKDGIEKAYVLYKGYYGEDKSGSILSLSDFQKELIYYKGFVKEFLPEENQSQGLKM